MKVALVNPPWSFSHSIYFGCREPHLPLEFGAARRLLKDAGHSAEIFDGHLFGLSVAQVADLVRGYRPDVTVVTTAPSYLFWRGAPPELRVPQEMLRALDGVGGTKIVVGPHVSTTPRAAMRKLGADFGILGELEEALTELACGKAEIPGMAIRVNGDIEVRGGPRATRFTDLPPL